MLDALAAAVAVDVAMSIPFKDWIVLSTMNYNRTKYEVKRFDPME